MCYGPTASVCFSAGVSRVTWYRADLTNVAKCTLQPSDVAQMTLAFARVKRNIAALHWAAQDRSDTHRCHATNEGRPQPTIFIGCCISRRRSSFMSKGMNNSCSRFSCLVHKIPNSLICYCSVLVLAKNRMSSVTEVTRLRSERPRISSRPGSLFSCCRHVQTDCRTGNLPSVSQWEPAVLWSEIKSCRAVIQVTSA